MNLFSGWEEIARVALVGTLAYLALVAPCAMVF